MVTVASAIADGRKRILAAEPGMVQAMLDAYELAWGAVEREMDVVLARIEAAQAAGEPVSESWLQQQTWWQQTQDSIEREMARFSERGIGTIARAQSNAVQTARMVGINYRAAIDADFVGRVNAKAMEQWVSAIQPNSPVREVLDGYGQRLGASVEKHVTEGLGSGKGPRAIVRNIAADVGPDAVTGRVHTAVRTESMRAYRGAHRSDMEALAKEIPGTHQWEWFSTMSSRTCPACLGMHGKRFAFNDYPSFPHPSCRCIVRLILEGSDLGVTTTGEQWLREQPEGVQRKVLRTGERYDAFKQGSTLADFTGIKRDRKWGESLVVRPMSSVRRAA